MNMKKTKKKCFGIELTYPISPRMTASLEHLVSITTGTFNGHLKFLFNIVGIEPKKLYLAGSRNGYKSVKQFSDLDLLLLFTADSAQKVCCRLSDDSIARDSEFAIDTLITHAQFGRFYCCYSHRDPLLHIDLGIITPEYLDLYLFGAPILDVSKINTLPSIKRNYREYIDAEKRHLARKVLKAIKRNNFGAALAHASRYLFYSGVEVAGATNVQTVINMVLADYEEHRQHGKGI